MRNELPHRTGSSDEVGCADVIIVGAGLCGTLAATLLGRMKQRVLLIDPMQIYPADFRAEQLVGEQVEKLSLLGLLDSVVGNDKPVPRAVGARAGHVIGSVQAPHYGIRYEDMVNRARRSLPASVEFICDKVVDVALSSTQPQVTLSDGTIRTARLVVLSTGLGQRLSDHLQVARVRIRSPQSCTFGFDVEVSRPEFFRDSVLVAYGERREDLIDYITIFSVAGRLRANLFSFGDRRSALTRNLVHHPQETLREALPSLESICGAIRVGDRVDVRINDLAVVPQPQHDGLVVVGDAFQTSCPAAGTGIGRLLTDIDLLCNRYVPEWLATPGMDVGKISAFYADPVKQHTDAEALRTAQYRRNLVVENTIGWRLHRQRLALQNRLRQLLLQRPWPSGPMITMAPATGHAAAHHPSANQAV